MWGVVIRAKLSSDSSRPPGWAPRFSSIRAYAAMSFAVEMMLPSAVRLIEMGARTSRRPRCDGRSFASR